jgi:hypothetical protein
MLEQARKILHTVVAYRYTFIRAFDGPTGQIASASPRKPAIFAGAVRILKGGAPTCEASRETIVTWRVCEALLCRRQDVCDVFTPWIRHRKRFSLVST